MDLKINLEYYRIFYTIAEYGSISAASAVLRNSQPNLTRSMKNLESALGCSLMDRSNRGITLTAEGKRLHEHLKSAFQQISLAEYELEATKQMESGALNIVATEIALRCFLLPVIKDFHALYPNIHIQIGNQLTAQSLESVKTDKVDFAIVTVPQNINISTLDAGLLSFRLLDTLEEVCICSSESELCNKTNVDLKDIENVPLVFLPETTITSQSFRLFYSEQGCSFHPQFETSTADQILPLVKANLGIGFVPKAFLANETGVSEVKLCKEIPKRNIYAVIRKNKSLSLTAKRFLQNKCIF